MLRKRILIWGLVLLLAVSVGTAGAQGLTDKEQLGKFLFEDIRLSSNQNQACADCHGAEVGFTGPDDGTNAGGAVYEGSVTDRFGNRKPPSAAYAGDSPVLAFAKGIWIGGMFWDGRAHGWISGDPLADQAKGPFENPLEQATTRQDVVNKAMNTDFYGVLFTQVCGNGKTVNEYYDCIAASIAAYERSSEVTKFTSRYDQGKLNSLESKGRGLFNGKGKCNKCHVSSGKKPLFTDFTYDNLGVPKNPENPFYDMSPEYNPDGEAWIDPGLSGFLVTQPYFANMAPQEYGKHKVPTLRNVAKGSKEFGGSGITKAYTHNGYFKTLAGIVNFYNTRDVKPRCEGDFTEAEAREANCWPAPEVSQNLNTKELGNLGLTLGEEAAIVAFLKTLDDI